MNKIIIIGGPTASGKSSYALKLAEKTNSVIINGDSLQLYRNIKIISAQPSIAEQNLCPHLLYGFLDDYEDYSVGKWCNAVMQEISQHPNIIIVGGTGLYLKSLIYGIAPMPNIEEATKLNVQNIYSELGGDKFYNLLISKDPKILQKPHIRDPQRMIRAMEVFLTTGESIVDLQNKRQLFLEPNQFKQVIIIPERHILHLNIERRFYQMVENGALNEAHNLQKLNDNARSLRATGLKELISHTKGEITKEEAIKLGIIKVKQYAKRQYTWFKHQLPEAEIIYP